MAKKQIIDFSSQNYDCSKSFHLNQKVTEIIFSDPDYVEGDVEAHALFSVRPIHVFNSNPNTGDFYIIDATFVINNDRAYHANKWVKHGGVLARIGGFVLDTCNIEVSLSSKEKPQFVSYPSPATDNIEKTYTISSSWSTDSSLTGGFKGTEFVGKAAFSLGTNQSSSCTYSINDLCVQNNSTDSVVKYKLKNNNPLTFKYSEEYGLSKPSTFAESSLAFHSKWIWRVPNVPDGSDIRHSLHVKMSPVYKSAKWYSSYADYDEYYTSCLLDSNIELLPVNRATPTKEN